MLSTEVCYCDSNYGHGISNLTVSTPVGSRTVRQVCDAIRAELGTGRSSGRIPYNDVQCGNGPPNDNGDEDPHRCPGRVDIGPAGCDDIGPRWDLDAVFGNTSTSPTPEPPPPAPPVEANGTSASNNSGDAGLAVDGNNRTRWTTETAQRNGQWFQLDLGSAQTVGSVRLDSSQSPNDSPRVFTLATSTDGTNFTTAATGNGGSNGVTTINFNSRSARYIRITQTGSTDRWWWSIHEMTFSAGSSNDDDEEENDNGGGAASGTALNRSDWSITASNNSGSADAAIDGNRNSRWTTGQDQRENQWFEIDLGETATFSSIELDSEGSSNDFPRLYSISVSENGGDWETVANGAGSDATTSVNFGTQTARYVRIEQSGTSDRWWWSIHEANLFR